METRTILTTLAEASRHFQVDPKTVGDIVRLHRIPTHRVPTNGKAKGLDRDGMKRLRKLLSPVATAVSA